MRVGAIDDLSSMPTPAELYADAHAMTPLNREDQEMVETFAELNDSPFLLFPVSDIVEQMRKDADQMQATLTTDVTATKTATTKVATALKKRKVPNLSLKIVLRLLFIVRRRRVCKTTATRLRHYHRNEKREQQQRRLRRRLPSAKRHCSRIRHYDGRSVDGNSMRSYGSVSISNDGNRRCQDNRSNNMSCVRYCRRHRKKWFFFRWSYQITSFRLGVGMYLFIESLEILLCRTR